MSWSNLGLDYWDAVACEHNSWLNMPCLDRTFHLHPWFSCCRTCVMLVDLAVVTICRILISVWSGPWTNFVFILEELAFGMVVFNLSNILWNFGISGLLQFLESSTCFLSMSTSLACGEWWLDRFCSWIGLTLSGACLACPCTWLLVTWCWTLHAPIVKLDIPTNLIWLENPLVGFVALLPWIESVACTRC